MIPGYAIEGLLRRSGDRCVYAAERIADHLPVAIKTIDAEYPSRQRIAELRREFHIIERLQAVPSVIRVHALEPHGNGNLAIVFERFGHPLKEQIAAGSRRFLPLARLLPTAIAIAEALEAIHERDVVHKNIEPGNILFDPVSGAIRLIDFRIASELSRERQNGALIRQFEGALPYMSPEQTGRMNRDLDYRSDYYSLGITLFELLTGALPFRADSPLSWVHCHISRTPPSPSDVDRAIPEGICAIVQKLMAKNAEDRYQSGYGLVEDLRRCQRELAHTGSVASFPLGHRDVSRKFHIPQRLYGREVELAALLALFERASADGTEICMVSGHSGIGKSALVNEIGKSLVRQNGHLIQGKFDQFRRSRPYSAVALAFRGLIRQLLAEPDEVRQVLRRELLAAIAPNGQLLIDLVPELELIIGPQPAVPDLPRTEAQNRFQLVFLAFVRIIAKRQPLVIFLDDLQFGDASTLNLIRWLATARDLNHLLVVGAYRSNEVDIGHPLHLALDELRESCSIHELTLQPLDLSSVEQLVADTLHTDPASCRELSRLLHERAQGNPFFLTEVLQTLEQARAIHFAAESGRWRWDLDAVRHIGLGNNVVDLVVANLRKLPAATQRVLQLAACIGNAFDLRTLSLIHGRSLDTSGEDLLPALQRHMVAPLNPDYKLVGKAGGGDPGPIGVQAVNPIYRFQHDRVQQAAYALIDPENKQAVHLSIGRLIQQHASAQEREARLIEIVGHLNRGRRLIDDPEERKDLAGLNLAAGIQAQHSSAYEAALGYLRIGRELLPADSWTTEYELTTALATECQQCAYLTGRHEEAESGIEELLARARTNLERAEILSMRTRQYATTGRMADSIDAAMMGLSLLGMRVTKNPSRAAIGRELAAVRRNLAGRRVADLISAPSMTDRGQIQAVRLLMEIFAAAFLSGSGNLFPFLVLKSVNISLRNGNSPESAFAYAAYGMLLCGALDDPALGYEFGRLAVAMNDRFDDIALKSRVIYLFAMFVLHWSEHWSHMTPWFRRGIEAGYQSGDLLYLAYSAQDCIIWDPRLDLDRAAREHADLLTIVRDCKYRDSLDSGTLFLQLQRNFLGLTDSLCSMNDATFDEERCLAGMRQRNFMTGIANYHIYKAEICFFYGRHDAALAHVRAQDRLLASVMSLPQLARFTIVAFLTLAACLPGMDAAGQAETRRRLGRDLRRMARWAAHCPVNFRHLKLLMQAERARLAGRLDPALRLYDQTAEAAHQGGFRRDEAMANELAARHLLAAGRRKAAEGYLRAARNLYEQWGACRKVAHLEEEFAQLLGTPASDRAGSRAAGSPSAAITAERIDLASLDMASVMKASQAISSNIVLDQLWAITMRIMLENAGGERGCFVVREDGQFVIEGLTEFGADAAPTAPPIPFAGAEGARALPISIVYQVLHTNSPVILHDDAGAGDRARDAYLLARKPRSVLCLPLPRHGKLDGAIYMENSGTAGVFTDDRIEVIKLLAAQVSISVENARLYEAQMRLIEVQQRFVPRQFLESLAHHNIAQVSLGEHVLKTMSVMFADLRGFTSLAERLDPRSTIELLNRYFPSMERPIAEAGGFIDSFAGDEIMALFDASADAAVRAGIGMCQALDAFNRRSAPLGQPALQMGIGVNTGPVVLGTVGSQSRIQCTVIGDTVNLASRIEQLTKTYGGRFLIGEQTFRELADPAPYAIRLVDRVSVVGKSTAAEIYEIVAAETPERRAAKRATGDLVRSAMDRYFTGQFAAALPLFERACAADPEDAVPFLFAGRCSRNLRGLSPDDRQGFERLVEK